MRLICIINNRDVNCRRHHRTPIIGGLLFGAINARLTLLVLIRLLFQLFDSPYVLFVRQLLTIYNFDYRLILQELAKKDMKHESAQS
jgi:hypothetical protein